MRGGDQQQGAMWSTISPEERVPQNHPLRPILELVNVVLKDILASFGRIYSREGRPSIPPEHLLRALLLQVLFSVRGERMLMEQLNYNLLFRWFVGLNMDDAVWSPTTFSKNRERLIDAGIAVKFFERVQILAREAGLLSDEHFTLDGTLIEAWAGHMMMDNKHGLAVDSRLTEATGRCEREAGLAMAAAIGCGRKTTIGGDKGYDTKDFIEGLRDLGITPHIAAKVRRGAIDGRTTRHPGYAISQRKRKRIEEIFGWLKTVAQLRKTRHRGKRRVGWMFRFALAAYNLVRMRNLVWGTS